MKLPLLALACALTMTTPAGAQIIAPLLSFSGDGLLAPGENPSLDATNNQRGLGYNSTNNHLYFVNRTGGVSVPILDATTGGQLGALDVTGISGGTFALNKIVVGSDGLIYGANLRTGSTTTQTFRLYRWDTEGSVPTLIFDAVTDLNGRLGDNLDVTGAGAATRLVAGYGVAATASNSNGYVVIDPTLSAPAPSSPSFTNVSFPENPAPPAAPIPGGTTDGDFRLGITFLSGGASGTVLGSQSIPRLTTYDANGTGTLLASPTLQAATERAFDIATVGGVRVLATLDTSNSNVRLYDVTDPAAPIFLALGNATTRAPAANSNSAGDIRWGAITGNMATLYALNTNNGIQAFSVVIPEPSTAALLGCAVAGLGLRRRRKALA